jgi:hypothetical protein
MPRAIEGTEGASQPFLSPDSRWIGFRRGNRLERISIDGGQSLSIADAPNGGPGSAWVPGGPIVFAAGWLQGLSAVSPDGGEVRRLTTPNAARNEIGHWFPFILPGGRHALFTVWLKATGLDEAETALLDLQTGEYRILFKGAEARYTGPGAIVFFRAGAYHAVRFDLDTLTVSGEPVKVLDDARGNTPEASPTQTDLSPNGAIAYVHTPVAPESRLAWVSEGGRIEELRFPSRQYGSLDLAPDGRRLAVDVRNGGRYLIRLLDLAQGNDDFIDLPNINWTPVWHPDGKRLAFRTMRKGDFDIYWKDVTSTSAPEPLMIGDADETPGAFTRDGGTLVVQQSEPDGTYPLKRLSVPASGPAEPLVPYSSEAPAISPDAAYVAYVSDRSGSDEVYILPLTGRGTPERISTRGGNAVAWSRDGRELYYARAPEIIAVSLGREGPRLRPMGERVWAVVDRLHVLASAFEVGPDGRILIALPLEPVVPQIRVILNWHHEIAAKLGLQ